LRKGKIFPWVCSSSLDLMKGESSRRFRGCQRRYGTDLTWDSTSNKFHWGSSMDVEREPCAVPPPPRRWLALRIFSLEGVIVRILAPIPFRRLIFVMLCCTTPWHVLSNPYLHSLSFVWTMSGSSSNRARPILCPFKLFPAVGSHRTHCKLPCGVPAEHEDFRASSAAIYGNRLIRQVAPSTNSGKRSGWLVSRALIPQDGLPAERGI
jgi:hypothetical protein